MRPVPIRKLLMFFLYLLFISSNPAIRLLAQSPLSPESGNILMAIKQLPYSASVLYIAAHPDDENNRLLTYLVKDRHIRTGYLALTRGEGGQNLIGKEQGDALGLIRTEELLAARKVDGAEQFFSRAIDFGYSKNPEETLAFWNQRYILSDIVWVIRKFRPDIIIDRFPTTGEGGHGNHTASAILTLDAIRMSADSNAYPEQLEYVKPWKVKKAFWNTFDFGGLNTTSMDQMHIEVNGYNPVLGLSYGELAAKSRSNHKSQGFGSGSRKGAVSEYFSPIIGKPSTHDLLEGIDTLWTSSPKATEAFALIQNAVDHFTADQPKLVIPDLLKVYQILSRWEPSSLRTRKLQEITQIILAASGMLVECTTPKEIYGYNDLCTINIDLIRRSSVNISLSKVEILNPVSNKSSLKTLNTLSSDLNSHQVLHLETKLLLDSSFSTQPYSLIKPHSYFRYEVENKDWISLAKKPCPLQARIYFSVGDLTLISDYPVQVKIIDPVKGEFFEPVAILPPVSAEANCKIYLFNSLNPTSTQKIKISITSIQDSLEGYTTLKLPKGWSSEPQSVALKTGKPSSKQFVEFIIRPPSSSIQISHIDTANIISYVKSKPYLQSIHKIEYDHIPWIHYTEPSSFKLVSLAIKSPKISVAYFVGAGDYIPEIMAQMGYSVHFLSDEELNLQDLQKYKTVIIGVRAYNVRNSLAFAHSILMNYVQNGGCLIVQYNTTADLITSQIGPYPFQITRNRITDEKSEVSFTNATSSLLTYPNKISSVDFEGWVQERGLYFPSLTEKESPYKTLLSMHDPKESALNTGIIYAKYGKGIFIYTGLSFFRQLPAGVPGAIRLWDNLINANQPIK